MTDRVTEGATDDPNDDLNGAALGGSRVVAWRPGIALLLAAVLVLAGAFGRSSAEGGSDAAVTAVEFAPPACVYADEDAPLSGYDQWAYTLLDTRYRLAPDYVPPDLVAVEPTRAGGSASDPAFRVRALVVDDLLWLLSAARSAGTPLAVQSAYRSYAYQESTFAFWVAQDGEERALLTSARPGHSEHQLGTALDFRSEGGPPAWDLEDWALEPAGAWLAENAHRYGFVMSYPRDASRLSCYSYEPWHFRYVGRELAANIHTSGLVPRVALWRMLAQAVADE